MGSGATAERIMLGKTLGESLGIQQHTEAMIPILKKQAEMELGIQEKTFTQELEQTRQLYLLANQLEGQTQPDQPVFITATETAEPKSNLLLYVGIAIFAFFLFKKK